MPTAPGPHDAGIEYGVLAADIAADNMAAHIAAADERMGAPPQPYADGTMHRPGELEGLSDLHGITPMPSRRASGDHAPTPSHADADEGDGEGSDEGERMGGLVLRHDGHDGRREGGAPFDGHDAFATSLDRFKHPPVDRLSEIIGFILRKEPWEIKPEDAKLLLVSRIEGGPALQVPSQKHAKWVRQFVPHVFFVESDTQDAGDIEESDRQVISTSGADSHTVTQVDDFIAVTRASSSSGKDSPYPKKVGQWQLALLKGHPDYGSDVFRGIQLKEARQIGRENIWCRISGPKLVHSVPDINKGRRVGAGSSSDARAQMRRDAQWKQTPPMPPRMPPPLPPQKHPSDEHDDERNECLDYTKFELETALRNYEDFHRLPIGRATVEQLQSSSAKIDGWLRAGPHFPSASDRGLLWLGDDEQSIIWEYSHPKTLIEFSDDRRSARAAKGGHVRFAVSTPVPLNSEVTIRVDESKHKDSDSIFVGVTLDGSGSISANCRAQAVHLFDGRLCQFSDASNSFLSEHMVNQFVPKVRVGGTISIRTVKQWGAQNETKILFSVQGDNDWKKAIFTVQGEVRIFVRFNFTEDAVSIIEAKPIPEASSSGGSSSGAGGRSFQFIPALALRTPIAETPPPMPPIIWEYSHPKTLIEFSDDRRSARAAKEGHVRFAVSTPVPLNSEVTIRVDESKHKDSDSIFVGVTLDGSGSISANCRAQAVHLFDGRLCQFSDASNSFLSEHMVNQFVPKVRVGGTISIRTVKQWGAQNETKILFSVQGDNDWKKAIFTVQGEVRIFVRFNFTEDAVSIIEAKPIPEASSSGGSSSGAGGRSFTWPKRSVNTVDLVQRKLEEPEPEILDPAAAAAVSAAAERVAADKAEKRVRAEKEAAEAAAEEAAAAVARVRREAAERAAEKAAAEQAAEERAAGCRGAGSLCRTPEIRGARGAPEARGGSVGDTLPGDLRDQRRDLISPTIRLQLAPENCLGDRSCRDWPASRRGTRVAERAARDGGRGATPAACRCCLVRHRTGRPVRHRRARAGQTERRERVSGGGRGV